MPSCIYESVIFSVTFLKCKINIFWQRNWMLAERLGIVVVLQCVYFELASTALDFDCTK